MPKGIEPQLRRVVAEKEELIRRLVERCDREEKRLTVLIS
jgi:hypothetical protein